MSTVEGAIVMTLIKASGARLSLGQAVDTGEAWIETKDLDFEAFAVKKMVRRIIAPIEFVESTLGLTLTIKWRNSLNDAFTSETALNLKDLDGIVRMRTPAARYFRLRFYDDSVVTVWRLLSLEIFGKVGSRRI